MRKICLVLMVSFLCSCTVPQPFLPKRNVNVIYSTDKTCEFELENVKVDNLLSWREIQGDPFTTYSCGLILDVHFWREQGNSDLANTPEGHFSFQPKMYTGSRKYTKSKPITSSVILYIGRESTNLIESKLELYELKYFSPCGASYLSTNNPNNFGLQFSEEHQKATGVFMEIKTEVVAVSSSC